MAWIPSHQALPEHPKTRRLAALLDIGIPQVIGHLHLLWWWCLDYADDGDLGDFSVDDISLAARWDGDADEFVNSLIECGPGKQAGFLDRDYTLHNWSDYGGRIVEKRRKDRDRQQRHRARNADDTGKSDPVTDVSRVTHTDVDATSQVEKRRTEQRREENPPSSSELDKSSPDAGYTCTVNACRCEDPDISGLTRQLARGIRDNGHKLPSAGTKAHHDWRAAIDKLLRIDKADRDEVERVIGWAVADPFWQANIQSAPTFRGKYTQLRAKMRNRTTAATTNVSPLQQRRQRQRDSADRAIELARQRREQPGVIGAGE